ncbi:uncharacterized protein A4U43_C02F10900 [Asparagus officinalis]|uniref:Uncharacterized protein n=1 Tax=Asparagus officinalis TaxID=4686 RepID=A0A5P1FK78_ASPOF|nr:uncharacterized protein A4U43_C02F10900 [Asparagus officinalis]
MASPPKECFLTDEQREVMKLAAEINAEVMATSPRSSSEEIGDHQTIKIGSGRAAGGGRHVRRTHSGKLVRVKKDLSSTCGVRPSGILATNPADQLHPTKIPHATRSSSTAVPPPPPLPLLDPKPEREPRTRTQKPKQTPSPSRFQESSICSSNTLPLLQPFRKQMEGYFQEKKPSFVSPPAPGRGEKEKKKGEEIKRRRRGGGASTSRHLAVSLEPVGGFTGRVDARKAAAAAAANEGSRARPPWLTRSNSSRGEQRRRLGRRWAAESRRAGVHRGPSRAPVWQ